MARVFTHSTSVVLATLVLALSACGGGDAAPSSVPTTTATATEGPTATGTSTPPTATAPSAPTPPPDAPTPTPTPAGTGESQPGGGGDEEGARVPVEITVGSDGTISPKQVDVPAFLALELRVRNRTAGTLSVTWNASGPAGTFTVGAGKVGSRRVSGVRRGRYPLTVRGVGSATVASGVAPGP